MWTRAAGGSVPLSSATAAHCRLACAASMTSSLGNVPLFENGLAFSLKHPVRAVADVSLPGRPEMFAVATEASTWASEDGAPAERTCPLSPPSALRRALRSSSPSPLFLFLRNR